MNRTLDEIANEVEDKMMHMCGCKNCIEAVVRIIKDDSTPWKSQCDNCYKRKTCRVFEV